MASRRSANMVKNHDQEYSRSIEIGQANQRLWPRVKRWCRHINVEMTSSGMLAQAMELPIGHLRVVCPHGHSNMEAMHLDWVAGVFIRQNCIGCPHHDEISPDNYGREVIAAAEQQESETKAADDRRTQLKAQAYEAAADALKSGKPTEESVNRFILDLFGNDEEAARSKDLLVQAAELGPELFSDASLRVMADAFAGPYSSSSIEAARIICRQRNSVPNELLTAALRAVEQHSDAACGLLCDAIEYGEDACANRRRAALNCSPPRSCTVRVTVSGRPRRAVVPLHTGTTWPAPDDRCGGSASRIR